MKKRLFHRSLALSGCLAGFFLASCGSTKTSKPGYANVEDYATPETNLSLEEYPFDEDGNYLADVVAGKTKGKRGRTARVQEVATTSYVDQYERSGGSSPTLYPGDTVAPVAVAAAQPPARIQTPVTTADYEIPQTAPAYASYNAGGSSIKEATVKTAAVSSKPKVASTAKAKPKAVAKAKTSGKEKPVVAKNKLKSAGKPVEKKSKPATLAYRVKRKDTLYGLANRYNTTVAAIKRANGMSSTVLRDGSTIRIPKGS